MIRSHAFFASFNQPSGLFLYWRMQVAWWVKGWRGGDVPKWMRNSGKFFFSLRSGRWWQIRNLFIERGGFIYSLHFIQFIHIKPSIQRRVHKTNHARGFMAIASKTHRIRCTRVPPSLEKIRHFITLTSLSSPFCLLKHWRRRKEKETTKKRSTAMRTKKEISIDVNSAAHKALICNLVCWCFCVVCWCWWSYRGLFLFANNSNDCGWRERRGMEREEDQPNLNSMSSLYFSFALLFLPLNRRKMVRFTNKNEGTNNNWVRN